MSYVMVNGGDTSHPACPVSIGVNRDNYFDLRGAYGAHYPGTMTPARGWTQQWQHGPEHRANDHRRLTA